MFLKVSPMKGVIRIGKKGKLALRNIGPFEIRSKIGEVAYKLILPPKLSRNSSNVSRVDAEKVYF